MHVVTKQIMNYTFVVLMFVYRGGNYLPDNESSLCSHLFCCPFSRNLMLSSHKQTVAREDVATSTTEVTCANVTTTAWPTTNAALTLNLNAPKVRLNPQQWFCGEAD